MSVSLCFVLYTFVTHSEGFSKKADSPTLSYYDHLQVLPVNVSYILVLSIIMCSIFPYRCIISTHQYCQTPLC